MAAQLGETTDKTALVPGIPESVHTVVRTLTDRGGELETVGDALGRVDTPSWTGSAASAFWDSFGPEKANWFTAADALTSAADTLSAYADTLSWAQGQAQYAIDLWAQGEAATADARLAHQDTLNEYRSMGLPDSELAPFADPGAELRQEAQSILDTARTTLLEAGNTAAGAFRAAAGGVGTAPDWLATAADVARDAIDEFGLSVTQDSLEAERTRDWSTSDEEPDDDKKGPDWSVALWEAGAEVSLWEVGAEGETRLGDVTLAGSASAQFLGASADGNFSFGSDGLTLGGSASAYLFQASAEGSVSYGIVEAGASGEVFVGAEAEGDLSVGADGVHVGGEAFAGASAEGTVNADVGGIGAGVTGEAWAGVGIAGDLDIGMEDGKFHIGGQLGAALGVGGSITPDITVDPGEVMDTAQDAADAVSDAAGNVADWAQDAAGAVSGWGW